MRVMLDTNILVSMIFFPTAATRRFARELSQEHRIVLCDYVVEELTLVVERKFPKKTRALSQFLMELPFDMVYTPKNLDLDGFPQVRDSKDSPILATAILEEIDVFVTGDKDFLVLNVEPPVICTMTEFMENYALDE